jgi:hypothetical protein
MNCPNCGVYNPEDRKVCWRCDLPLPKPQPPRKRSPQITSRVWLYIALAGLTVVSLLRVCGGVIMPGS